MKGGYTLFFFYFNAHATGNGLIFADTFDAGADNAVGGQIKGIAGICTRFKADKPFAFGRI